ncbi:MAG TPA: HAMP domain-containing sensor histidine kinase [Anaerolineae bacterium]|nr:HAMP domain-containing sensor histidine kinase [Anaerolineae bacterium]
MSLRSRLLLSYVLVVLAFLTVIVLGATILLRDNPVQTQVLARELAGAARLVARSSRLAVQSGASPDQIMRRLSNAAPGDVRLMFVDGASGIVLADSGGALSGENLYELSGRRPSGLALEGEFESNGERWLYAAQPVEIGRRGGALAVAAAPAPSTPLLRDPTFLGLLRPLLIAAAIALVIASILAVIVARSIARPIQHVASAANAIASGDLAQKAPVEGPHEVRELAASFNAMADRVRASQQSQRDFLANVSHELKTPLTSIRGFAQAIADGAAGDGESIRKSASVIHEEAERMTRMVGDLLDLARIETGQLAMLRLPVQVGDVLRSCVERQSLRAQSASVSLALDTPGDLPVIHGDGDRLAQVFNNLIDNALKHTPPGGKVAVSARAMTGSSVARRGKPWPGAVEVSVADSGPGIPAEDLSRIFERFYQVDKSRVRSGSSGSLGLGLAIAKEIVAAHGGSIHAESVTGLGTKFVVRLPIERG